jgi:hypothetical protein
MLHKQAIPFPTADVYTNGQAPAGKSILGDRILVDLIDELEYALAVIESTGRRSRTPASNARLNTAATVVDAAIVYLRNLRG